MRATGDCQLCGERAATDVDHKGRPGDSGPIRGFLCHGCNVGLHVVERVGGERVQAYLDASPIGPPYRATRRARHYAENREHERAQQRAYYRRRCTS